MDLKDTALRQPDYMGVLSTEMSLGQVAGSLISGALMDLYGI
jgi:hypothetical protein